MLEGKKDIEVRLYKNDYKKIKPGDTVIVHNTDNYEQTYMANVLDVRRYENLKELFYAEDINRALPGVKNVNDAIKVMRQFYTKEDEDFYGAIAIEVKIV